MLPPVLTISLQIIGAPSFFSTVWGWVKRWFDPATVSKIFILAPHEIESTLATFIDPENIPKQYGGKLTFNWGDLPTVDPAWTGIVEWENGYKSIPTGPMIWRTYGDGSRVECVAVGQKNGKDRNERVCSVPKTYYQPWETAAQDAAASVSGTIPAEPAASAVAKPREGSDATYVDEAAAKMAELGVSDEKKIENAASAPESGVAAPSA